MNDIHGAPGAGPSTPTSDETSTAGTVRGLRDQEITTRSEYEAAPDDGSATASPTTRQDATLKPRQNHTSQAVGASDADRKRFATLQARAALQGVSLVRSTDDRDGVVFIASKWTLTRQLDTVDAVESFLARIGGQHAG